MKKALVTILAAALLVSAAPLAAFTLVERGSTLEITVRLTQAALCDGSVRLEAAPASYRVQVTALGENKVHARFIDFKTGKTAGEAHGIIAVLKQTTAAGPGGANMEQKVQPAPGAAVAINFTKLGFDQGSQVNFLPDGPGKLNFKITSNDGTHEILIGLLLPAVQKVREAAVKPQAPPAGK